MANTLKKRILGGTGIEVSELGLGTWPIGGEASTFTYGDVNEAECSRLIMAYIERGGDFIDTARGYGHSERIIGETLDRNRACNEVVIATKAPSGQVDETLSRIREDCEDSLRLLKCDVIDLFQLHQPPGEPDLMNCALDILEELRGEGKIRFLGASIKGPDVTEATEVVCRRYLATGRLDAVQVVYRILRQRMRRVSGNAGTTESV